MEHRKAPTPSITMVHSSKNNNAHRQKERTVKQRRLLPPSPAITSNNPRPSSILITDSNEQTNPSMKTPFTWTKKWTKWFSSCGDHRVSHSLPTFKEKRARTKSENDVSKRGSVDHDGKKKLSATNSSFALGSNEDPEENLPRTTSHHYLHLHHQQSNERVNNSNTVVYRDNSRRYSTSFFTSARYGGPRASLAALPITTATIGTNTPRSKQSIHLSRSVDRLHNKSNRRELRYEEHDDYIPPPPLYSIQYHPTIEHYNKNLTPSSYFSSHHRRSQLEAYQLSSTNHRLTLPRPYSSNFSSSMSKTSSDNNAYGKLSDCHSPLSPVENSSVKAPRRIESAYSQFPTPQEPVYANTQSLYDNIVYPLSTLRGTTRANDQEKKSCASQTQLTWTMATFSSFVDLENQSMIIPQPDPNTLYSIVQHFPSQLSPSASAETVEQIKRMSPGLPFMDDTNSSSHYQRPRSPSSLNQQKTEKRDGSFQTLLTIGPTENLESNKHLLHHMSTPSPLSSGSSSTGTGQAPQQQQQQKSHHHHHHHHRKHKSRSHNITTRDVGLQVNIQTVKKITFSTQKSEESSLATTTSSPPLTEKPSRELKNVQTNTDPLITKRDRSTSYEGTTALVTSSSQTLDSPTSTSDRQTKAAQTSNKTLRDQAIETNHRGLFVCDLSSLLKNGSEETTKRKS